MIMAVICTTIVNRGKWVRRPVNMKEANKQTYVGRPLTLHFFRLIDYA